MFTRGRPAVLLLFLLLTVQSTLAATGTLLVVNKSGDSLSLLDLATGDRLRELPTGHVPHEVAVSPDGRRAIVSNYGTRNRPGNSLTVVDIPAGTVSASIDLGDYRRPHGLAWLPDNRRLLVTAEENRALLLVDVDRREILRAIATGQELSHMVSVDPAGKMAYVANIGSGSVSVIDIEAGRVQATLPVGAGTEGISISPDGQQLWVTNRESGTVVVLDLDTMEVLAILNAPGFPIRVALSPDGAQALVSRAFDSRVEFFDTRTLSASGELSMPREYSLLRGRWLGGGFGYRTLPIGVLYHPDGGTAYVANAYGGYVAVLDVAQQRVTGLLYAGAEPDGLAYSRLQPALAVKNTE